MAKHRGAAASRAGSGCMGLFGGFCISVPPGVVVAELIGDDGLPALVHMHMAQCMACAPSPPPPSRPDAHPS
jgi:hypothetical protein